MLLACIISGMAETEPEEVARMIGEVALNRAADSRFPSDLRRAGRLSPVPKEPHRVFTLSAAGRPDTPGGGERLLPPDAFYFEKREGGYGFLGVDRRGIIEGITS